MSVTLLTQDARLVQIMDAALADAAECAGSWLACRIGCTQCCHGVFPINALDTERLRWGMKTLRAENPALAADLSRRAQTWIDQYGSGFPGDLATGILGESDEDQSRFEDYANEAPCPALDPATGRCDVYPWRPMTCRAFGPPVRMAEGDELGCCELCFIGATETEITACEMTVPHDIEAELLDELADRDGNSPETIVAFALLN